MTMIPGNNTCGDGQDDFWGKDRPRDVRLQIYLSVTIGVLAFLSFCYLRPRWKGLYAARKKQNDLATALPDLPDSFFGWIIPLWRITDDQVLASAGLDAYVYLAFFKMAMKFLLVTLFFALAVIKPVHDTHKDGKKSPIPPGEKPPKDHELRSTFSVLAAEYEYATDYLWMYLVFVYLFTALIMYLIISETRRIIDIRQEYLGSQTTITDRTIRLSGIPKNLRSEDNIKNFIEDLGIGKVDSVTLCKNWRKLDASVAERQTILRKLEEAWTVHLGSHRVERSLETLPVVQPTPPVYADDHGNGDEASRLIRDVDRGPEYITPYARQRPTTKLRYGRFKLRYKVVDAIDYYEEKLRRIDDDIRVLRKAEFEATGLAFVTMDSVASAQMAIQAVLDPSPLQLLANNSPAPSDVVWSNTYLSRSQRIFRSWSITVLIGIMSIFWTSLFVPIAGALNTCSIRQVFPGLADALSSNGLLESLVNTQLPTLALTLINVLVPFLYDWVANMQGMISQGDVELSVISKNFFFTFFNFFILFTVLGAASDFVAILNKFAERLTSATQIAYALAESLSHLLGFYTNFIILQAFGLFPLRLMELGALTLYPVYLMGAKTPRGQSVITMLELTADIVSRLRGTRSAPGLQLRFLLAANDSYLHHLHGLQRVARFLAGLACRAGIFHDRALRPQVSAALRHGTSSAFHWQRLDHDVRPHHWWSRSLPDHRRWSVGSQAGVQAGRPGGTSGHLHSLVLLCLRQDVSATYEVHCPQESART